MEISRLNNTLEFLRREAGNFTLLQTQILLAVMDEPGITQPDLGKRFGTTQATVCRTVNLMRTREVQDPISRKFSHKEGFLLLKEDVEDARRIAVFLTEKGAELKRRLQLFR
jgi:DNA-binding MarR family transcriptional regulator